MDSQSAWLERLAARGMVPDGILRLGVRMALGRRLRALQRGMPQERLRAMRNGPTAVATDAANRQHYEVPTEFFRLILGPRLKYSTALWPSGVETLADAEDAMLELYAQRAGLADGQRVLDLGCGWGSFALWAAAATSEVDDHRRDQLTHAARPHRRRVARHAAWATWT